MRRAAAALALAAAAWWAPTAVAADTVRFAVKGDWGWGGPQQTAVTRQICAGWPFAFVLTTGDNFSRPEGVATRENWDLPERCLIRRGARWRAAWGNHDLLGDATARVLGSPRRSGAFRAGPALVVVLDGNRPGDPGQFRAVRRVLATARVPVRIAVVHQPLVTSGIHRGDAELERRYAPLFRRHDVTLVLQGHNHLYERIVRDGVTYVTTGGGGAPLTPCVRPTAGLRACRFAHHFLEVRAGRTVIDLRAIDARGRPLDRVRLPVRGGPADPRRIGAAGLAW
jgi:tartrate-resistant acid phosphatase type 5